MGRATANVAAGKPDGLIRAKHSDDFHIFKSLNV